MNKSLDFPKFIVYGTGVKTKELLEIYSDKIIGLMDNKKTNKLVFNKPVLNEQDVIDCNVKVIIIAARKANIPIIYRRIETLCTENGILVYDEYGNLVEVNNSDRNLTFKLEHEEVIKKQILEASVVSFDIFDTLLIRRCLYPNDVFKIAGEDNIVDNYDEIFQTEYELIKPRPEVVSLYEFAVKNRKDIYFVSDMYLFSESIHKLLKKCEINIDIDKIIVSCEYGTDKPNNLFEVLKNRCKTKTGIIHIGDSYEADFIAANKNGITGIKIDSRLEILDRSNYNSILKFDYSLDNRNVIGELLSSDFEVEDLISPFTYKFTSWIKENSKKLDLVLLGARDGWLIDLISNNIDKYKLKSLYFNTSRVAAVSASLLNETDIRSAKEYAFSGDINDLYKNRFASELILSDSELLKHSKKLRKNYLSYLDNLYLDGSTKVGFVDFVSAGTSFYSLKKILPFELIGLFACKVRESDENIKSMYEDCSNAKIMSNYFALEDIFTSPKPTLKCFDDKGKPIYFEEKRLESEIENICSTHNKILDYGNRTLNIDFNNVELILCDYILGLLEVKDSIIEDEFCGR